MDTCEACGGYGEYWLFDRFEPCSSCRGSGLKRLHAPEKPDPEKHRRAMRAAVDAIRRLQWAR